MSRTATYQMSSTPAVPSSMRATWPCRMGSAILPSAWRPSLWRAFSPPSSPSPVEPLYAHNEWSTPCPTDPRRSLQERSLANPSRRRGKQKRRSERFETTRLTTSAWGVESRVRIAVLAPISWRVPPRHYGPWELFASLLTEGLVSRGHDVTLFATSDSETSAVLSSVVARGWSEDPTIDPKVAECLHISEVFERASEFDVIHNSFDFLPLTYSGLISTPVVTTIHGFSSPHIVPVYAKYNENTFYVAISKADMHPSLEYLATIHHGIRTGDFTFNPASGSYLAYFGRIHRDKGLTSAIDAAEEAGVPLRIAGIIQDELYFKREVAPRLDGDRVQFIGPVRAEDRSDFLGGASALLP